MCGNGGTPIGMLLPRRGDRTAPQAAPPSATAAPWWCTPAPWGDGGSSSSPGWWLEEAEEGARSSRSVRAYSRISPAHDEHRAAPGSRRSTPLQGSSSAASASGPPTAQPIAHDVRGEAAAAAAVERPPPVRPRRASLLLGLRPGLGLLLLLRAGRRVSAASAALAFAERTGHEAMI